MYSYCISTMDTNDFNINEARKSYNAIHMLNYYKRKANGTLKTIILPENQKKRGRPFKLKVETIEPKILLKRGIKPDYNLHT